MDKVFLEYFQFGAVGITAVVGFYLYFKERKLNMEQSKIYLQQQIKDAKAKVRLTNALESQHQTIEWIAEVIEIYMGEKQIEDKLMAFKEERQERIEKRVRRRSGNYRICGYLEEGDSSVGQDDSLEEWEKQGTTDIDKLNK